MDIKSVNEIFTNRILRIPSYQRGYAWSNNEKVSYGKDTDLKRVKGQLMDLWTDIINIEEGKWHYTGLLTFVEVPDADHEYPWLSGYKEYAIVDGQQRITSILILIAVMIDIAESLKKEFGNRKGDAKYQYLYIDKENTNLHADIFGYKKDNPSNKFFRKHILALNGIEDDSEESIYTENLKKARDFFYFVVKQHIKSETESEKIVKLEKLYKKVTNNLKFNEYILPDDLDHHVVFETMNNRGKPLSELEKLKNRLMYLCDKVQIEGSKDEQNAAKQKLEKEINTAWITIYRELGANKKSPLGDEDFIKAHWIIYFEGYSRSEARVYSNHLFNELNFSHFFELNWEITILPN